MTSLPVLKTLLTVMSFALVAIPVTMAASSTGDNWDIREPPGVHTPAVKDIPDMYFKVDETINLPCTASGIPKPMYTWYINGNLISSSNAKLTGQGGNLQIVNSNILNEGDYQCVASNKWGKSLSQVILLRKSSLGNFPGEKIIKEYIGTIGEPLRIERLEIKCIPGPVYTWRTVDNVNDETPQSIYYTKMLLPDIKGNLYFTTLEKHHDLSDTGKFYKVDVRNSFMDLTVGGSYSRIKINSNEKTVDSPVKLIYPSTEYTELVLVEGQSIKLNCIFGGIKPNDPDVQWDPPSIDRTSLFGTRYTIEDSKQKHTGIYTCKGMDSKGISDTGIYNVTVETIPKFTEGGRPGRKTMSEGEQAEFTCEVSKNTNPMATVHWMINNVPINEQQPGKRTEIRKLKNRNGKVLIITNLKRDDDIKVIQCVISNDHKTIYADAPLNVLVPTQILVPPMDAVIMRNITFVNFSCSATTDDSTKLKINWMYNGKPLIYYDDHHMVEAEGILTLNLSDVEPGKLVNYQGAYVCNASNGYSYDVEKAMLEYISDSSDLSTSPITFVESNLWLIILIIVLLLLVLIFFLVCCGCCVHNKGGSYYVDEKEWATGNDPIADEKLAGFHDYVRPPVAKRKDSRASLTSTVFMGSMCSLDFGTPSIGGMSEGGSFIGLYNSDSRRKLT